MIVAPLGMLRKYEIIKPEKAPVKAITTERRMIVLKLFENRLAAFWGMVINESSRIIPTTFMFKTMVRATSAIRILFIKLTFIS